MARDDCPPKVLEAVAGPVFIGQVDKKDSNLMAIKDCLLGLGKKTGGKKRKADGSAANLNQEVTDLLRAVDGDKHEFLYQQGSDCSQAPIRIAFERLCRFHGDAGPWQKHPIDGETEHPMVKHVHKMYTDWVQNRD